MKNKGLTNPSKINKEDVIFCFNRLVETLARDPAVLWTTLDQIAPPRTSSDVRLGRGYEGDYSNSPGGGPAQLSSDSSKDDSSEIFLSPSSQHEARGTEARDTEREETPPTTQEQPHQTQRLCRSVWTGRQCSIQDCSFAHPPLCSDPACRPQRRPECKHWHTVRTRRQPAVDSTSRKQPSKEVKSGNFKKGIRSSPLNKRAAVTNLQLEADLAKTKLALHKAQRKASQKQASQSYASAAMRNLLVQPSQASHGNQPASLSQPLQSTPPSPAMVPQIPGAAMQQLADHIAAAIIAVLGH